jgi:hypothetical protein
MYGWWNITHPQFQNRLQNRLEQYKVGATLANIVRQSWCPYVNGSFGRPRSPYVSKKKGPACYNPIIIYIIYMNQRTWLCLPYNHMLNILDDIHTWSNYCFFPWYCKVCTFCLALINFYGSIVSIIVALIYF